MARSFSITGQRGPTPARASGSSRPSAPGDMNMMRHCRQCRADAVGLLGEDQGAEFADRENRRNGDRLRGRDADPRGRSPGDS